MTNYLFDVDGTLTNPREPANPTFKDFFGPWVNGVQENGDKVFLVTGSDQEKTLGQIGLALYRLMNGVYQNSGNQCFVRNSLVYESKWMVSGNLKIDLLTIAEKSPWFGKATTNIEERVGMANFSTIGRTATPDQREAYALWDKSTNERKVSTEWLSQKYPKLQFDVGGQISIDIYPKGRDKSQVLKHMIGETIFFGDTCHEGGNDYIISRRADKFHQVKGWKETMSVIKNYYMGMSDE